MQGAAAMAAGVREDQVAVASTGVIGVPLDVDKVIKGILAARGELARRRRRRASARRSAPPTRSPSASRSTSRCRRGTVRLTAQAKGAGMISPALRDDALLRPDRRGARARDRRPAARRLRQALVRPHLGRRAALHQRHRDPDGARARSGVRDRARVRGRAALRRGARLRCCAGSRCRSCATARAPGASAACVVHGGHEPHVVARRARGRQLAAGQGRAARRRPELGPDRAGGRRRAARRRAAAARHLDRGRAGLRAAARRVPLRRAGARRRRSPATEVEYAVGLPGEGAETEVFFSDLSHEYVTINAEYTT